MEFEDRSKTNSVRFVLLHHRLPASSERASHWDLMIEEGDFLLTFELRSLPDNQAHSTPLAWPATRLPDHRLHYLEYEGTIAPRSAASPAAGQSSDRGSVRRLAAGQATCQAAEHDGVVYCRLQSAELSAEFDYVMCRVGQATQLNIKSWHWARTL